MYTIVGADGKPYGPVSKEKIVEWIAGGRANLQTRAQRLGETEWKTLGEFAEFGGGDALPPGAVPTFPPVANSLPGYGDSAQPGAAASAPRPTGTATEIAADILARTARLDVFGCLAKVFSLWTQNFFPLVGVTLVVYLITLVIGFIPILGMIAGLLLNGVFYGGLYYYYLGKMRGEPREFGDAFAGFKIAFGPLVVVNLLMLLILIAVALVLIGPWVLAIIATVSIEAQSPAPLWMIPGIFVCSLPVIYLSIAWVFAPLLVIDQGMSPWTAMEVSRRVVSKQWFRTFFTLFFGGILAALGVVALFIGIFFTMPLAFGAITCAYEDMFIPPPLTA